MTLRYLGSRVAQSLIVLFVLSFIIFSLVYLAPGDVVKTLVGTRRVTPEVRAAITAQYHLNDPFLVQYGRWLLGAIHGDFGTSIRSSADVVSTVSARIAPTFFLTSFAALIGMGGGMILGIVAARRADTSIDRAIVGWSIVGVSAPGYAIGLVLLYVFSALLRWFPTYGEGSGFADQVWHLTLPAVTLALGIGAMIVRITRASLITELNRDYVTFARSRNLPKARLTRMYLRNASIPILTSAGLIVGTLFGSTVLVENVFSIAGIGTLLTDSINFKDVPVVQAIALLLAAIIVAVTLVVDVAALLIDPTQGIHRRRA